MYNYPYTKITDCLSINDTDIDKSCKINYHKFNRNLLYEQKITRNCYQKS